RNYYPNRTDISSDDQTYLHECEKRTIDRADAIVLPTQWAAQSVLEHYGASPEKVHVVEWGANVGELPEVATPRKLPADRPLRFLFVGLDWERKGGDIAVDAVQQLNSYGIASELTVVGCRVPSTCRHPWVNVVRRLDRANPTDSQELDELFLNSDIYFHPARAECYGHALCEAQAFGMPVVSTDTGGISQCVRDGVTGILLPAGSSSEAYAQRIAELVSDAGRYANMSVHAAAEFAARLNWERWTTRVVEIFQKLAGHPVPDVTAVQ
ncbi:MAG: glycosyltransferase family 4 protein, partial [Planctomycetales bacterium]|nr:glycosyltransferase family 4 protein [Planctomycetales bacterium]